MESADMKYTIEWHGNAGNYFLFKEQGGTVSLDPNSEDGKDIINRLNSYDEMQQRIAQLEEALRVSENQKNEIANNAKMYIDKLHKKLNPY